MSQELLQKRKERIRKAIALEKVDKTPVVLMADSFYACQAGMQMANFISSFETASNTMLGVLKTLGDVDGVNTASCSATLYPQIYMAAVKLPGRDLPPDTMWQLDERECLTEADYDTILKDGWTSFMKEYLLTRLGYSLDEMHEKLKVMRQLIGNVEATGHVVYVPLAGGSAFDMIAGGRSMQKFTRDMYKSGDKLEAVLDRVQEDMLKGLMQRIDMQKPEVVFISPARGASEFLAPKLWQRFVWKNMKGTVEAIVAKGCAVNLHLDANWERDLDFFRELPKGRVIFESDGMTNHTKFKEKLGDMMCFKGDVPAAMLSLGTPDEVYTYSRKLISEIGQGLILSSGCSIPPDAKLENVKAMIAAAAEG